MSSLAYKRMVLYACAVVFLLLCVHMAPGHVIAAPASWPDKESSQKMAENNKAIYMNLVKAILQRIHDAKEKRARADGGFFSRHDAMSDYLQSAYANSLAMDLYGPGKRK